MLRVRVDRAKSSIVDRTHPVLVSGKLVLVNLSTFLLVQLLIKAYFVEVVKMLFMPKGHSTLDKALAWHTGSRVLNPDTTKVLVLQSLPVSRHMHSFSHNACCHVFQHEYLSRKR